MIFNNAIDILSEEDKQLPQVSVLYFLYLKYCLLGATSFASFAKRHRDPSWRTLTSDQGSHRNFVW